MVRRDTIGKTTQSYVQFECKLGSSIWRLIVFWKFVPADFVYALKSLRRWPWAQKHPPKLDWVFICKYQFTQAFFWVNHENRERHFAVSEFQSASLRLQETNTVWFIKIEWQPLWAQCQYPRAGIKTLASTILKLMSLLHSLLRATSDWSIIRSNFPLLQSAAGKNHGTFMLILEASMISKRANQLHCWPHDFSTLN